jgi:hypothetical protein
MPFDRMFTVLIDQPVLDCCRTETEAFFHARPTPSCSNAIARPTLPNQGHQEGRQEGRQEGVQEGQQLILLDQLRTRFGVLPEATIARVMGADTAELGLWAKRILSAPALEEVFRDP